MFPRASANDPVLSGQWEGHGPWLYWTWLFSSGWREWVPATVQLTRGLPDDTSREHTESILNKLHQLYHVEPIQNMWQYTTDQTSWYLKSAQKSAWYYDTIPEYSPLARDVFGATQCVG